MKDGIIELDTNRAQKFGFTSDKFYGYLWKIEEYIWISVIMSKQEGQGNFKKLLDKIKESGYKIIVPTPFPRMQKICKKRGLKFSMAKTDMGPVEIMIERDEKNQ